MTAINQLLIVSLLIISACTQTTKEPVDTGFELGNTDEDADADADADNGDNADDGSDPENSAPEVTISSPNNGDVISLDDEVTFFAVVSDDNDDATMLEVAWSSDRYEDILSDAPAEGSGAVTFSSSDLVTGTHVITLKVTDRDGQSSEDAITIRLEDGDDADADGSSLDDVDGDGVTIEEGDCNDDDEWTYPGAREWCDGEDNNCDDVWDTEFYDDYEPNEVMGTAKDLGEIDADWFDWDTASITVTDLNFDSAEDEDWFSWFADDDPGDHPDIAIYVEGEGYMYFIVELYVEEWDTTIPMATAEGFGSASLEEDDFEFASDWWWGDISWDHMSVRVRTMEAHWDEIVCEDGFYSITIES
jgi:hypothetical protein